MYINQVTVGNNIKFEIEGRLDTINSPEFEKVLIPAFSTYKTIVVDFSDVDYVSSAGLRVLLIGQKNAKQQDVKFTIINVPEAIMSILRMTGFDSILHIE